MSTDEKPMPDQPKTTELPAASPLEVAIAQLSLAVDRGFTKIDADLETVKAEGQRTNLRLTRQEVRMDDVETRLANTSQRAHAIVTEHTSQVDMEAQSREAARIVKDQDRDRQIAETRALAEKAATKDDVAQLASGTATKAEVERMLAPTAEKVDSLTATQEVQLAILSRLDKVASNPTVKVIAGMIATALLTWLASHGGSLK